MKHPDHYYKKSKREGYLSRAAYKLKDIQDRFTLIRSNSTVLELGAAPGGWTQVILEYLGEQGRLIAIDLKPLKVRDDRITFIQGDILSEDVISAVKEELSPEGIDVILSDMAPNITGVREIDDAHFETLISGVFAYANALHRPHGNMAIKFFRNPAENIVVKDLKSHYRYVRRYTPPATRKHSRELYFIALGRGSK